MKHTTLLIWLLWTVSAVAQNPAVKPPTRPNLDYVRESVQVGSNGPLTWTDGMTNFIEGTPLTASRARTLPHTASYAEGGLIKYFDAITTGVFGPLFLPAGGETLKGSNAATWGAGYQPFAGGGYGGGSKSITFIKRGTDWQVFNFGGESLAITGIRNPTNFAGLGTFDATSLTTPQSIKLANSPMAFVVPFDADTSPVTRLFVDGFQVDGTPTTSSINGSSITPITFTMPNADVPASPTAGSIPNDGSVDSIKLADISQIRNVYFPDAANYIASQPVRVYGGATITSAGYIRIFASNGNTFNTNSATYDIVNPNSNIDFRSDGVSNWTVSGQVSSSGGGGGGTGLAIMPFTALSGTSFAITTNPTVYFEDNRTLMLSGDTTITAINNALNGSSGYINVTQPASGGPYTLTLPANSYTGSKGAGAIYLPTGANEIALLHWQKLGTNYVWSVTAFDITKAGAVGCTTQGDITQTSGTSTLNQGFIAGGGDKYIAFKYVAAATFSTCDIEIEMAKVGAPPYNVYLELRPDDGAGAPSTSSIITTSDPIAANTALTTSKATYHFTGVSASIASGTTYWVILRSDYAGTPSTTDYVKIYYTATASNNQYKSSNGTTWNIGNNNVKLDIRLNHT